MENYKKKISFNKGGGTAGYTCRLIVPKEYIESLNITKEDNEVIIYLEKDKIIIEKSEEQE